MFIRSEVISDHIKPLKRIMYPAVILPNRRPIPMHISIIAIAIVLSLFVFVILEAYDKVNWIIANASPPKPFITKGIKK